MGTGKDFPVLKITQFEDYCQCHHFGNSFYIREFNEHLQENKFLHRPHGHDFYILLIITEGSGVHYIDFKSYQVFQGAVFLIIPGQVHHWELSNDVDGFIIFFSKEYLLTEFHQNQLLRLPFFYTALTEPFLTLDNNALDTCLQIVKKINTEYQSKNMFYQDLIRLNLKILLLEIERKYSLGPSILEFKHHYSQLGRFEELVEQHYKDHCSITEYASLMHLSTKQLNGLCKKLVGKTPGEILHDRIILEAKRLLIHSDYTVLQVSELLNYNDNSYFIRLFKKATNKTPEQFRNQLLKQPSAGTLINA